MTAEATTLLHEYDEAIARTAKAQRHVERLKVAEEQARDRLLTALRLEEGIELKRIHDALPDDPACNHHSTESPSLGVFEENN